MATDTPISEPIKFTDLRNVFGVADTNKTTISLYDYSRNVMGDIGQTTPNNEVSVAQLLGKNLPLPAVVFTPNINTNYSSQFEQVDASASLNTQFNYRKRVLQRFTVNAATATIKSTVAHNSFKFKISNNVTVTQPVTTNYGVTESINLTPYSTFYQSTSVPYSFTIQKRNGLEVNYGNATVDVNDVVTSRANKFNFGITTNAVHHTPQHTPNPQNSYSGGHNPYHHQQQYGQHAVCHAAHYHHNNQHNSQVNHYHQGYLGANSDTVQNQPIIGPDYATFSFAQQLLSTNNQGWHQSHAAWNLLVHAPWGSFQGGQNGNQGGLWKQTAAYQNAHYGHYTGVSEQTSYC